MLIMEEKKLSRLMINLLMFMIGCLIKLWWQKNAL